MKYIALLCTFCISGFAAARNSPVTDGIDPRFTVVVQQGQPALDDATQRAMEKELQRIFRPSGTRVDVATPDLAEHPEFGTNVVVARIIGRCEVPAMPPVGPHRADTLGRTLVTDGRILPFVELDCNQIAGAVRASLLRLPREGRAPGFGRALARVLAHEIYHVLAGTWRHSPEGIACESLSGDDLTAERLDFRYEDFESMGILPFLGTN